MQKSTLGNRAALMFSALAATVVLAGVALPAEAQTYGSCTIRSRVKIT